MPLYRYKAVDASGAPVEGTMSEQSPSRVTTRLQEQGLQVNLVEEAEAPARGLPRLFDRLTWEDIDLFNEQLLAIVKSGMPLAESLKALADAVRNPRVRKLMLHTRVKLQEGSSISEALGAYGPEFSQAYLSAIRSGERAGNLSGVLVHMCRYSSSMVELKNSVLEAIAYPVTVLAAAFGVVLLFLTWVVPEYRDFFGEGLAVNSLPVPTRFVFFMSDMYLRFRPLALVLAALLFAGLALALHYLLRADSTGPFFDRLRLRLPLFGRLYLNLSLSRFCRTLGLLLAGDVSVIEGLSLAASAAGNASLEEAALQAERSARDGARLSDALEGARFFPIGMCSMIAMGEERGNVDETLTELADFHERAANRLTGWIKGMFAPAAVLVAGLVVTSLVLALYLPMLGNSGVELY